MLEILIKKVLLLVKYIPIVVLISQLYTIFVVHEFSFQGKVKIKQLFLYLIVLLLLGHSNKEITIPLKKKSKRIVIPLKRNIIFFKIKNHYFPGMVGHPQAMRHFFFNNDFQNYGIFQLKSDIISIRKFGNSRIIMKRMNKNDHYIPAFYIYSK